MDGKIRNKVKGKIGKIGNIGVVRNIRV